MADLMRWEDAQKWLIRLDYKQRKYCWQILESGSLRVLAEGVSLSPGQCAVAVFTKAHEIYGDFDLAQVIAEIS